MQQDMLIITSFARYTWQIVTHTPHIPIDSSVDNAMWPIERRWLFWERNSANQIIIAFNKDDHGCLLPH